MPIDAQDSAFEAAPRHFSAYACREARRILTWGHIELAGKAGVHIQVVKNFERLDEVSEADRAVIYKALCIGGLERLRMLAAVLRCDYPEAPRTTLSVDRLSETIASAISHELARI